jgi:hypothetical protein
MREWSNENGAHQFFGFVNPGESAMVGRKYWTSRAGFSHRFLEGARQWQLRPENFLAARSPIQECREPDIDKIAAFLKQRLEDNARHATCAIVWTLARIKHQLRWSSLADVAHVKDGNDQAVCSFSAMPTHSGPHTGYIDFLAGTNGRRDLMKSALNRALASLKAMGCERILTLGAPTNRNQDLEELGFIPCFPSFAPLLVTWSDNSFFSPQSKLAVVYR